jgi:hypothetical protein
VDEPPIKGTYGDYDKMLTLGSIIGTTSRHGITVDPLGVGENKSSHVTPPQSLINTDLEWSI